MFKVEAWTDGSCRGNPGPGGYAAIVIARNDTVTDKEIAEEIGMAMQCLSSTVTKIDIQKPTGTLVARVLVVRGKDPETTNNRMEVRAILEAIKQLDRPCTITIHTDSAYAIGVLSGRHNGRANKDIIAEWMRKSRGFKVKWNHVEGHSPKCLLNNMADLIAGASYASG